MRCKNCNSSDIRSWKFNLYGTKGYKVHCVRCGREYFISDKEANNEYTPLDNLGMATVNKDYVPSDTFGAVLAKRKG